MFNKILKLLCIITLLSMCSCDDSINDKKFLVMGTSSTYPPFEFREERKIVGFDIDLATMITKKLGYELQIQDMDFYSLLAALQTHKVDFVAAALTATPERIKNLDFSEEYYESIFAMLYRNSKPLNDTNDLNGTTIGTQLGTTMELFLKTIAKDHAINIVAIHRITTLVQDLSLGRVDGVLMEESQAKVLMGKYQDLNYSVFPNANNGYAIAFPKGSLLKERFNAVISELKKSGEIDNLRRKWGV